MVESERPPPGMPAQASTAETLVKLVAREAWCVCGLSFKEQRIYTNCRRPLSGKRENFRPHLNQKKADTWGSPRPDSPHDDDVFHPLHATIISSLGLGRAPRSSRWKEKSFRGSNARDHLDGWSCTEGGATLIISAATTLPGLGLERAPPPIAIQVTPRKKGKKKASIVGFEPGSSGSKLLAQPTALSRFVQYLVEVTYL